MNRNNNYTTLSYKDSSARQLTNASPIAQRALSKKGSLFKMNHYPQIVKMKKVQGIAYSPTVKVIQSISNEEYASSRKNSPGLAFPPVATFDKKKSVILPMIN